MDIASLSVKIDTSDVARAEEDLDRLGGKGAKAEQAAERIGAAYNDAAGKVGSVSGASAKAGEALDSLGNKASAAAQSARTAGVAYGQAATGMTGASGAAAAAGAALGKSAQAMHLAGLSAGQYSQAMRMLPMQLTDVVTSLASGMPVWQVAIQQGGQVRDAFGGVGNAARAVVSAIGPVGIGLGVAAAALGTLVAAHEQGAAEARTYEQALILTGNAAGTSADALARMAIAMDKAGTTQHAAAAALAEVTGTGKFAENQIHAIAAASLAMEEVTGKAVSATVKEFSALADAPAAASAKLNEQYHYLTASVYEQISALEEQGRTTEAAKLATDTYAEAMRVRTEQMRGSLGILERAFIGLGKVASEAWDSVLDIDREKTLQQQIERTKALIEDRNTSLLGKLFPDSIGPNSKDTQFLKDRLALLESTAAANAKLAEEEGKRNQQEQANIAASKEVDRLNGLLDTLKGMGTYTSAANRWIKENAAASDEQKREVLGAAAALDAEKKAQEDTKKATNDATNAAKQQAEALSDFLEKSGVVTKSSDAMAKAYLAGAVGVRELTIQQEIENELLKTGESAREAVTKAVRVQRDAEDLRDVAKNIAGLRTETELTLEQAAATLGGAAALDAFNVKKAMQTALVGKNISVESEEYKLLLKQTQARLDANKALEQAARVNGVMDRLYPQQKLLRDYKDDQEALNKAIEQYPAKADEYRAALVRLSAEYEVNKNALTAWGKFTERQLDRVDQAFSDAWLNIGHGFDSFSSGLKRSFEQMLAELAHMAITRPIMLQIGSALGVVSSAEATASQGIWGGFSSGLSAAGSGLSLYSGASGLFGAGATAVDTSAAGASIAGYTSPQYASWVAGQSGIGSIGSALSAWAAPVSAALGLIKGFSSYLDGERVDAKGSRGSIAAWATGYQPLAELNGAINKLTKMVGLDGTILGGIINAPGMILQGIGNALFGSWKIKDYGIALGVNDGELNPQSYVYKKKKGLLTGTKKKTSYDPLTGDSAQQLQEAFATTEDGVASIFEQLGYAIDDGTYAGLKIARSKISTKGKTEEEVSKAVQDWFTAAGESINSYLNATLGTGLSYDIAGMTTFVNDLYAVNGLLDHLNVGLFSTNVAGGKLVEQLLGLTGGLDALTSSVSTYYDQFFSDAEKQANTLADVTQAFADANQTLPATRAEYRAMVESIDLTTEAGRSMFATLMNLAGQADSYYDIVEQRAQAVQAATSGAAVSAAKGALSTLSSAIGAEQQRLSDAYNARVASINDRVGTANSAVSSLTAVGSSLDAALKQLAGSSEQATALLHEQAVATLRSALAFAKAGGSLAGFAGLQDALDSAGNIDSGRYSTREDLQREQGRTANLIAQLQGVNGTQLTTEQRILDSLQGQLDQAKASYDLQTSGLDAQLTAAQAQLDALLGIDSGVKSVADALSLFVGAMQQAQALQDANASITSVIGPDGVKHQVASNGTVLDPNGASMGLKVVGDQVVGTQSWNQDWWFNLGQDGQMSWAAGQQTNLQAWAKSMGIPGFATGGDFGGGLRLVGEQGPELEVTGPSRIFNARQTADLLSGGGASADELRGLRADLAQVFEALRAIAKHTMKTARNTDLLPPVLQQNEAFNP